MQTLLELTEQEAAAAAETIHKHVMPMTEEQKLLARVVIRTAIADALIQAIDRLNTQKQ